MTDLFDVLARMGATLPTVQVEPFTGDGAYGPVYGPKKDVRGWLDDARHRTLDATGSEVTAGSRLFLPLGADCPVRSRITLPDGRTTTAVTVARRDGAGLPTPDHLEVSLL